MRLTAFFATVVLIPFAAHCVWGAEPGNDHRLDEFFGAYLDRWFALRPLDATRLGDHRFDHRLDDLSPGARAQWIALMRETLEALPEQVDYRALTRSGQIDFEILRHELVKSLWLAENARPYEEDPRIYNDYISDSVFLLLTQSSLPKETNITNALARMEQIPQVIAAARANLRNPPAAHIETAIGQNRGAIAFYERGIFELAVSTPQRAALEAAAARVAESLRGYQRFLESDLRARAPGEWRLGRERFCRKLELEVDGGVTADEVLADAQREFERVERDMFTVARQLWSRFHPGAPLPPDDSAGRRAAVRSVLAAIAQDHSTAETVVADVRRVMADVKRFIADARIVRLPQPDQCEIIEMPEFQRGNSTAYMNSPPPLDPRAGGYYAVSPPPRDWDADRVRSYFEEYNSQMLRILTIHEAYPGHYVQLEYANRNPSLVRRVLQSGVYIEGWAVYTEAMMLDQGFGEGSLPLRLTQLKFYLRAVANAILDHKMHCADMSDDEALRFLTEDAFQSEGEARLKIVRAKQSSVQLSTYFAGRMAMGRLRQAIQREMGERFALERYHEAVLEPGAVPVKYLPELVRARLGQPR
ncbi:MAG: DUF885 domain-containing protein [Verrucomicrobia bacterium]|nr:DUF885 domain-containing protein [Verrucomicrobiota bacterium]OQC67848.1 MAG: hypothetical protein BWX48_00425 [Verrucomicrobia bacterium ADurb.Bin006]MDI9382136.1 DUF885 domain-containing protein [Verrucomicrobiota bacterium]NMD18669.1 DUF885 domain-containing protein [Verrucomicrobiota bacterium]HNU98784.1 DUF885 domain-containing protein [Verrucomicrobiota bacterium]